MNGFLAALDNISTPPVNPSSLTGDIPWPSPFKVQTYEPWESELYVRIFGNSPTRFIHFAQAIQLMWAVQDSVLAHVILRTDPTITYDDRQLVGQFEGVSTDYRKTTGIALTQLPNMDVSRLPGEYAEVWKNALSPVDKLAAVVAYFGAKYAA